MPRVDRDINGKSTQRVSQHEILRATARDYVSKTKPANVQSDMNWDESEAHSGPLSVKLGDLVMKRASR